MKTRPESLETEQALIWALLVDGDIVEDFFNVWEIEWFNYPQTRSVAKAIFSICLEGEKVDIMSVNSHLEKGNKIESIGWITYLMEMMEVGNSFNWRTYSKTLHELYRKREIMKASELLMNSCSLEDINLDVLIENSFSKINGVMNAWESLSTNMESNIALLEEYIEDNKWKDIIWWSWGNEWLDEQTLWVRKGKTYRIGAPSWVGKTNLIYGTIKSLLEQGAKVLFVSLENDIPTTYSKFLSTVQNVNNRCIEKGEVAPDIDWLRKYKDKFFLTDQTFELNEIKREVLRVKPDVVILDYIGLVTMSEVRDVDKIFTPYAKQVKEFVQKTKVAWIDLSNLNTNETEDEIRKWGKFNGSAALKNNTDFWLHMFHYKPYYEYKEFAKEKGDMTREQIEKFNSFKVVSFLITKNRMGVDNIEKQYWINFDKGINYLPIPQDRLDLWNSF